MSALQHHHILKHYLMTFSLTLRKIVKILSLLEILKSNGDFNARTKTDDDYIIYEEDRFSPINDLDHYVVDPVPITRSNTDSNSIDSQGERILELCKSNLLRILSGRFGNNSNRYTRCPAKLGDKPSVIDYTLTSKNLSSLIKSFNIEPFTICSEQYSAEVEHE